MGALFTPKNSAFLGANVFQTPETWTDEEKRKEFNSQDLNAVDENEAWPFAEAFAFLTQCAVMGRKSFNARSAVNASAYVPGRTWSLANSMSPPETVNAQETTDANSKLAGSPTSVES
mmetsp:Transcript_34997/g.48527  ORF Transcript_34997/g.48527 Transcript_34997/m.48527 type:complete len:118 (+) Transcript_34997:208-561(+)|eukprot:CAMPEP_0196570710 /NCGR_PEP_ID=MMETSP1081-20130531/873_1 /TAXON_ID=36882 /ORGANISM="Pyramimonas amylifera, Strain CCMP720" /LENGTH=117 /DNA_ID=CAMNT_0041887307 /DNA_START=197 /DNA_END=550 /DNA_ORIENTATION=+